MLYTRKQVVDYFQGAKVFLARDTKWMTEIKNQGKSPTCWGQAGLTVVENHIYANETLRGTFDISNQEPLERIPYVYPMEKRKIGSVLVEYENHVTNFFKYFKNKGVYRADDYDTEEGELRRLKSDPPIPTIDEPKEKLFISGEPVWKYAKGEKNSKEFHAFIRRMLNAGKSVAATLEVLNKPFFKWKPKDGMYRETEKQRSMLKENISKELKEEMNKNDLKVVNHTVVIVGYGGVGENAYYIILNSWGADWGVGGFAMIKASYITGAGHPKNLVVKQNISDDWWEKVRAREEGRAR